MRDSPRRGEEPLLGESRITSMHPVWHQDSGSTCDKESASPLGLKPQRLAAGSSSLGLARGPSAAQRAGPLTLTSLWTSVSASAGSVRAPEAGWVAVPPSRVGSAG